MGNLSTNKHKQQQVAIQSTTYNQLVESIISKCSKKGCEIKSEQLLAKFKDLIISRSFGCLFGCFIGDALGAFCQFQTSILSTALLNDTMQMNGGGVFNLYKGQFTDDSQLAYHLMKGLSQFNVDQPFIEQKQIVIANIMKQYLRWRRSDPFDLGITCRKGIQIINNNQKRLLTSQRQKLRQSVQYILSQVKKANDKSQSNGSLMRIAPLAIFFSFIDQDPIIHRDFIKAQISTIHPNQLLQAAGYVWVKVLYDLITRKDDKKQTYNRIYVDAKGLTQSEKLLDWFKEAQKQQKMPATDNMGWAKIAWTYGMKIIYKMGRQITKMTTASIPDYVLEIKEVIRQAGDSDTNAAIVGGLIGAIIGFQNLNIKYLSNILNLQFPDQRKKFNDRPKQYEPLSIFFQLLQFKQKCQKYKQKKHKSSWNLPKAYL